MEHHHVYLQIHLQTVGFPACHVSFLFFFTAQPPRPTDSRRVLSVIFSTVPAWILEKEKLNTPKKSWYPSMSRCELGSMVGKLLTNYAYKWGNWGINPLTNLLRYTPWNSMGARPPQKNAGCSSKTKHLTKHVKDSKSTSKNNGRKTHHEASQKHPEKHLPRKFW